MKKIFSIILSVIILLSILPVTVNAAEVTGTCGENVTWAYDDSTSTLTISGEGEMGSCSIGSMPWKEYKESIKKVVIENGVTTIGDYAFWSCENITEVIISESVVSIGKQAFDLCTALERILIPNSVKTLGVMFVDESVVIDYCGTSTEWISIKEKNGQYLCCYFVNCQDGKIYPSGKCGDNLTWMIDDSRTLIISGTGDMWNYDWDVITYWRDNAEKVIITEGVTSIGEYAFYNCQKLLSAEIAGSVKKIGFHAFGDCYQLLYVTIGYGVEIIGEEAFCNCKSLLTLEIPDSVKKIDYNAFDDCINLTDVSIGKGVSEIYGSVFSGCRKLERIVVDEDNEHYLNDEYGVLYDKSKTTIIAYPSGSSMTEYVIPDGVTDISGMNLENDTNLTKLTIPGSVTTIERGTFHDYTNLTTVIIGDGVKTIDIYAFKNCSNLEKIIIPDSVTTVGKEAFYGCTNLKTVIIGDGETTIGDGITTVPDGETTIGERAFQGCSNLEKLVIGKSVETIGKGAFDYCNKLSDVYYTGSYSKWIRISGRNDSYALRKAKIHYNCQKVVTPPTCTEEGYVTYTCSCCDVGCVFDSIEPIAHNYVGAEIPATCTTHGYTNYTCDACGKSYIDYTANPTGHTFNEDGICEICGEKETTTNHVNPQMLTIESVLAMVMNLLAKIFGVFSVA